MGNKIEFGELINKSHQLTFHQNNKSNENQIKIIIWKKPKKNRFLLIQPSKSINLKEINIFEITKNFTSNLFLLCIIFKNATNLDLNKLFELKQKDNNFTFYLLKYTKLKHNLSVYFFYLNFGNFTDDKYTQLKIFHEFLTIIENNPKYILNYTEYTGNFSYNLEQIQKISNDNTTNKLLFNFCNIILDYSKNLNTNTNININSNLNTININNLPLPKINNEKKITKISDITKINKIPIKESPSEEKVDKIEDEEDELLCDLNEDYINKNMNHAYFKECKSNRTKNITSFKIDQCNEEINLSSTRNKNNKIKPPPLKYNRNNRTNRSECFYNNENEEDYSIIIEDFLYLSSYKTASTLVDLKKLKISNIINCSGDLCENLSPDSSSLKIEYLTLNLKDNVQENIECLFYKCINLIEKVKNDGGRILIHCYKGVSRSVSIVIAYLIYKNKWNYDEAFEFVQSKRSIANPNINFYLQLKTFHKRITATGDRLEIFCVTNFHIEQPELIVCRLIYNNIKINDNNINEEEEKEEENENEEIDKKEILLNEKGLFIFVSNEKSIIVKGKNISEKNLEVYKKNALEYIGELNKYEGIGGTCEAIIFLEQEEFICKWKELVNDDNIVISFVESNNMDKFYIN